MVVSPHVPSASLYDPPPCLPSQPDDSRAIAITFGVIENLIALATLTIAILAYRRQVRF